MLKDLMHAIFKEDIEDEDVLNEEETEAEMETEAELANEPVQEEAPVQGQEDRYARPKPQPIVEEPVVEVVEEPVAVKKDSIFNGMDIETISARTPKRSKSVYKFDRSKLNQRAGKQENGDYQAVISPIFGNLEDEKKEFDKVHDAIQLPKPDEDFTFVQVISPMYGNDIPEVKPVSSIPVYEVPVSKTLETKKTMDLSELLEKKEEKKAMQESLFKNTK